MTAMSFMNPRKGRRVCVHKYLHIQFACIMFAAFLHDSEERVTMSLCQPLSTSASHRHSQASFH